MRLLSFSTKDGDSQWGVEAGDRVVSGLSVAPTLDAFVQSGKPLTKLQQVIGASEALAFSKADIDLDAPLRQPGKIVAIGQNYMDHCRECNAPIPTRPIVFTKFTTSINSPTGEIAWRTDLTTEVDWEVEMGVVIGKQARRVSQKEALDHVFGYTVVNDVSARDLQGGDGQWVRGKSLDTFCPMGPVIVTADEIPDPQALELRCLVNGTPVQDSNTSEMIFNVRYLISFLSHAFTLLPGDVILSGTPYGIGAARDPQIFLHDGDVLESEVERIGRLRNVCRVEE
jgi:2-keto-4-pentenoate hydratase/2-oxohepta-3-ene-1,7-dioic acid hydratase in catechol pathway